MAGRRSGQAGTREDWVSEVLALFLTSGVCARVRRAESRAIGSGSDSSAGQPRGHIGCDKTGLMFGATELRDVHRQMREYPHV